MTKLVPPSGDGRDLVKQMLQASPPHIQGLETFSDYRFALVTKKRTEGDGSHL